VELLGADLERRQMRLVTRHVRCVVDGTVRTVDMAFKAAMHLGTALTLWPGLSTLTVSSRREALLVLSAAPLPGLLKLTIRNEVRACMPRRMHPPCIARPPMPRMGGQDHTLHPACLAHNPAWHVPITCCHARPHK
jgi:hypothetical protein